MILSFSKNMPWFSVTGATISTKFMAKIHAGMKKHTFRNGVRWNRDTKIHAYMGNPRNGGESFNFLIQNAARWVRCENGHIAANSWFSSFPTYNPTQHIALPLVDGVESFRVEITELGDNGTMMHLSIEGSVVVECEYNLRFGTILHKFKKSGPMLRQIALNDGLSEREFLRWFQHIARKDGLKVMEGQIVHWTPLRYVAPMVTPDPFMSWG